MDGKIKVLLVDDEKDSREVMARLLQTHFDQLEIVGEAANVDSAFQLVAEKMPDLVFLDIQMPKANGFSLLKRFDTVPFEVIFVTSFDQFAINAIKFSALDYLLKPVEVSDLKEAVDKAIKIIDKKQNSSSQIIHLLHGLQEDVERTVAVHSGDKVRFLSQNDIVLVEADGRYCHIYMQNSEVFVTAKYLKEFEAYFGENAPFVRINKTYLLNSSHIVSYSKGDPCIIEMANGKLFEASRRKKQEVLERLKHK